MITYRQGAYAVDPRTGTLAVLLETKDNGVRWELPGGGGSWTAPVSALRLAMRAERERAGLRPNSMGAVT